MKLEIVTAGPILTVQDRGRSGLRHLGVSSAGPIDADAMALANALCANHPDAAALEFAGPGGSFRATGPIRFAVITRMCDVRIDGQRVATGESHRLATGETLSVAAPSGVVWGYLAVSGGIWTEPVMGARATHLRNRLGGVVGRALRAGDALPLGAQVDSCCLRQKNTPRPGRADGSADAPIRVILGPQADHFTPQTLDRFQSLPFHVTTKRDRMAMVLDGVELPADGGHDIVSDGTVPGSIQVPGSRQPLVLLTESQTTGGYPKIATIASVDLARLAQMPSGRTVRFSAISRQDGEQLWCEQRRNIRNALNSLEPKGGGALSSEYLLSCDLIGGVSVMDDT